MKYVILCCAVIGAAIILLLVYLFSVAAWHDCRRLLRTLWRRTYIWQYFEYRSFVRDCINNPDCPTERILSVLRMPHNANRVYLANMYRLTYRRDSMVIKLQGTEASDKIINANT